MPDFNFSIGTPENESSEVYVTANQVHGHMEMVDQPTFDNHFGPKAHYLIPAPCADDPERQIPIWVVFYVDHVEMHFVNQDEFESFQGPKTSQYMVYPYNGPVFAANVSFGDDDPQDLASQMRVFLDEAQKEDGAMDQASKVVRRGIKEKDQIVALIQADEQGKDGVLELIRTALEEEVVTVAEVQALLAE